MICLGHTFSPYYLKTFGQMLIFIIQFQVQFDGDSLHLKNSILDINKVVSYMVMTGLHLSNEAYTASVTAINAMYVRSNKVSSNITVQPSPNIVGG